MNSKSSSMQTVLVVLLIGLAAGMLSGLIGIGGGIVIVPALVLLLGYSQHQAMGTSLALLLLPAGILAVINYYRQGYVDLRTAAILFVGFIVGGYLGSKFSLNMSEMAVKRIFAVVMILVAGKMLFFDK